MNTLETMEVRRYRNLGNAMRALILLGVVAGLAAIGAQAPQRDHVTLNCAYDPVVTGTISDATPAIPDVCASPAPDVPPVARSGHSVPDASSTVGAASGDEVQPPTF